MTESLVDFIYHKIMEINAEDAAHCRGGLAPRREERTQRFVQNGRIQRQEQYVVPSLSKKWHRTSVMCGSLERDCASRT